MDFLGKELVCSYDWSDFNKERKHISKEIIDGRTWFKTGRYCSTAFVGDIYKLNSDSDESFKYIMLVGISRQHPNERKGSKNEGIEIAAQNAKTDPIIIMKFMNVPFYKDFKNICESYLNTIPYQYLRTKEESDKLKFDKQFGEVVSKLSNIDF